MAALIRRKTSESAGSLARRRTAVQSGPQIRALRAAATRIEPNNRVSASVLHKVRRPWQLQAWDFYNQVGELQYGVSYQGNSARRMSLFPAVYIEGEDAPVHIEDSPDKKWAGQMHDALGRLGGTDARSSLFKANMENFSLTGECFLVSRMDDGDGVAREVWEIRSISEVSAAEDGGVIIRDMPSSGMSAWSSSGSDTYKLQSDDFITRLWRPHPQWRKLAHSPMQAAIETCLEELVLLGKDVRASATNRLALNGLVLLPDTLSVSRSTADEDTGNAEDDPFLSEMIALAMEAISDPGSAAAALPMLLRGPADAIEKARFLQLARPETEMLNKRAEAIKRLATTLDIPAEILLGLEKMNHWCMTPDTEILTSDGWVTHDLLNPGDTVLTLNHETGLSEWQPVNKVNRFDVVNEPMLSVDHKFHSSMSTMNHRWPVLESVREPITNRITGYQRAWTTSGELTAHDRVITGAPNADVPTEAKWSDAFVELVGWFFTEGTCIGTTPQVRIGQSHVANPDNVARIRRCLTALHGPAHVGNMPKTGRGPGDPVGRWRETPETRGMTLFGLNKTAAASLLAVAPDRVVSLDWVRELTAGQLDVFINAAARGDGSLRDGGGRTCNQRDPARLAAVELAAVLAGYPTMTHQRTTGGYGRATQWELTIGARPPRTSARGAEETTYTGIVWCPTTGNQTWLARRNGKVFYTGNSAWRIDEDAFQHHIEPDVVTIADGWTAGYFRPYLLEAGVPEDVVVRSVIWYDPTALLTKPDRTEDAKDAFDRHLISGEAARKYLDFPEEDKPKDDETIMRLMLATDSLDANLAKQIVVKMDPSLDAEPPPVPGAPGLPGADGEPPEIKGVPGQSPAPNPPKGSPDMLPVDPDLTVRAPAALTAAPTTPDTMLDRIRELKAQLAVQPRAVPGADLRLSRQLSTGDREIRETIRMAAEAAVKRALERAGARVVTRARQKDPVIAAACQDVPAWAIPARVGPAVVAALGLHEDQLLALELVELESLWTRYVTEGQTRALRVAARLIGGDAESAIARLAGTLANQRAAGWSYLVRLLTKTARGALAVVDDVTTTAVETARLVPTSGVRAALALAGGFDSTVSAGIDEATNRPVNRNEFFGQLGTGPTVTDYLKTGGAQLEYYVWNHGFALNPFEPHEQLDGLEFVTWSDDALSTEDFTGGYYPGDHNGCSCDVVQVWSVVRDRASQSSDTDALAAGVAS